MLRFARNIGLLFTCYALLSYGVNKFLFNKAHKSFLWSKNFETLVLGDSGMFLMNEYELQNSLNLSRKGSIYKVMYYKLKEINKHKEIKNVVIPFSFSNISKYSDNVLGGISNTEEYIRRLYPVTSPWNLFSDGTDFMSAAKVVVKYVLSFNIQYYNSRNPVDAEYLFRDPKFNKNKSNKVIRPNIPNPESIMTIERNKEYLNRRMPDLYPKGEKRNLSYSSLDYLDDIVRFTQANAIKLYLVRMPLTSNYQKRVPHECITKYNQLADKYEEEAHIQVIDYMNIFINEQTVVHFGNDDHSTAYGAAQVSKELNKIVNR